jgi:hypothetical protein
MSIVNQQKRTCLFCRREVGGEPHKTSPSGQLTHTECEENAR